LRRILVLHGPNLNTLGRREPAVYGRQTLAEIDAAIAAAAAARGAQAECRQSNHEGDLVAWIQQAAGAFDGILLNAAGLTHTSVAIRDAVVASGVPTVEVHLSNPDAREPFRKTSLLADVVVGRVAGFRGASYTAALAALLDRLDSE
jgi:3-dehydroquinate dehydratase II